MKTSNIRPPKLQRSNKRSSIGSIAPVALLAGLCMSASVQALDVSISGFIRQEAAYKFTGDENPYNRQGARFDSVLVPNTSATGAAVAPGGLYDTLNVVTGGLVPDGATVAADRSYLGKIDGDQFQDNDWNVLATKAEVDFTLGFSENVSGFVKVRGYYQPDVFADYGDVNQFERNVHGSKAEILEISDDDYFVDLPAAYIDYASGPLWVRVGQQQIAWGESLFFRVADVPNGLDLTRHLFLDFAAEEYSDERQAAPGVRVNYSLNNDWSLEVFTQMFQPSTLPARNSAYNVVAHAFVPDYQMGFDKVDDRWNTGLRVRGDIGNLGMQFFAVSRTNPDPVFRWLPGGQVALDAVPGFAGFSTQPFQTQSYGVASAAEWFDTAALSGLNGFDALNALGEDFAFDDGFFKLMTLFGVTPGTCTAPDPATCTYNFTDVASSMPTLDVFFTALGGLGADLEATYAYENVFGFGFNYIFYAEPDTFLDQLVVRFEGTYTPDKTFTNPNLSHNFLEKDEWVTGLVFEKYHRFSNAFPATFVVFEWMHKSESDLLGRHLSGLGGDRYKGPGGGEDDRGWDGLVFALQQPFPNLVWRADLSVLYDLNGGFLVQPGVRYKPSAEWTVEGFVNFVDSKDNATIFQPIEWSDDVSLRLTYQF